MKRVLAITDSYNWATYFRAINLESNLKKYRFKIVSFHDINDINFNDFDIVYILNWPIYGYVRHKISKRRKYKLVTGVSSHIGRKKASDMTAFFSIFDSIGLSNMFLMKEFKQASLKGLVYTPFGVNHNTFKNTSDPNDYRNVFGWVGNKSRDVKRYRDIKSAFKDLGPEFKLKTVGNTSGYSRDRMAKFYNSIGTLICYSKSEGTPNPVLESAMCGRAIISTNVGNVPELMSGVEGFRPVTSYDSLLMQIKKYRNSKNLRIFGSKIEKIAISNWTWQKQSKRFVKLFE